jgi:uncharacterized protein (DUF4415 family)
MRPKQNNAGIKSDLARARAMPDDKIDDSDSPELDASFFSRPLVQLPDKKRQVTIRLDESVLAWFKSKGKGYQGRINAVLRAYVDHERRPS